MSAGGLGGSVPRKDALAKVTGKAKYTADYCKNAYFGKVLHSDIANGRIISMNLEKARALPGVLCVLSHADVPDILYNTAGCPYGVDENHKELLDRYILTDAPKFVGDAIAAVVATDELAAYRALDLIEVEYEEYTPYLTMESALSEDAMPIHPGIMQSNIVSSEWEFTLGEHENVQDAFAEVAMIQENKYTTSIVQHAHIEPNCSLAYVDDQDRIVLITSTQVPFTARKLCAVATGIPEQRIQVIKPHVGGGFGNKQDILQEPLNIIMTLAVHGHPVYLAYDYDEMMVDTRTRMAIDYEMKLGATKEGIISAVDVTCYGNSGAYVSHGHNITITGGDFIRFLYRFGTFHFKPITVCTNLPASGAMRGYGVPQSTFAFESAIDDLALKLKMDPIELRLKNLQMQGYCDPYTNVTLKTSGIRECIEKGKQLVGWDEKRARYASDQGPIRRGIGIGCIGFCSDAYPYLTEMGGARITLNEDGTILLFVGAAEIGQGSDTILSQLAAEVLSMPADWVTINPVINTDVNPYDSGAYSTRQTYVSGNAVVKTALLIKEKMLSLAAKLTEQPVEFLALKDTFVVDSRTNEALLSYKKLAMMSYYSPKQGEVIQAEVSLNLQDCAPVTGCTFAEVEVNTQTCQIEILNIINLHDSGRIINPMLARGQVYGGMAMGIGYGLFEMIQPSKNGMVLNNNLLDYKIPTFLDVPTLKAEFVELTDPSGPLGAKGLGEPPTVSPAAAIRNAILHATGISFNHLPITPQRLFEGLQATKGGSK